MELEFFHLLTLSPSVVVGGGGTVSSFFLLFDYSPVALEEGMLRLFLCLPFHELFKLFAL
jgi:hypothetical protein